MGCTPNASLTNNGMVGLCFFMTGYDFCKKFLLISICKLLLDDELDAVTVFARLAEVEAQLSSKIIKIYLEMAPLSIPSRMRTWTTSQRLIGDRHHRKPVDGVE